MMILYKAPRWLFEGANPKEQRNFKRGIEVYYFFVSSFQL